MATFQVPRRPTAIDTSRYESSDGSNVTERPLPNKTHAEIQFAVTTLLRQQAKRMNHVALQEWSLDKHEAEEYTWMTPDVLVVSKDAPLSSRGHALPPALLAVEILSPGQTYRRLMREKVPLYLEWGVEQVWIIDPASESAMNISRNLTVWAIDGFLEAGELRVNLKDVFQFE